MPHRCTNCKHVIDDESEHLLSGCPDCKNQSWEYVKKNTSNVGNTYTENKSQQEARTEFINSDKLPKPSAIQSLQNISDNEDELSSRKSVSDIDEIKEQLNKQYDGIKVVRNGKYKINLAELYRGNNHIIEIGDDGAYTVSEV